jgi:hypothetical protein
LTQRSRLEISMLVDGVGIAGVNAWATATEQKMGDRVDERHIR